jgi:hypothetical protein
MYAARLGGVTGVADLRARRRSPSTFDCRGVFAFRPQHENEMLRLFGARQPVEFEGVVEGEPTRLMVTLVSLDSVSGVAFFEGSGESTGAFGQMSSETG